MKLILAIHVVETYVVVFFSWKTSSNWSNVTMIIFTSAGGIGTYTAKITNMAKNQNITLARNINLGFTLTLQETWSIHDFMNIAKIEFIAYIYILL